jgi:hypothetical protein
MSETVALTLITALAGFLGALLGAVAAVIGPWWLKKSDRKAATESERIEARRAAIVEWVHASIALAGQPDPADPKLLDLQVRANQASVELLSRLRGTEFAVAKWINDVGVFGSHEVARDVRLRAYSEAAEMIMDWHRGNRGQDQLRPFQIVRVEQDGELVGVFSERWPSRFEVRQVPRAMDVSDELISEP